MGFWDRFERAIGGGIASATDLGSQIYHKISGTPTAKEKRDQQYAINDQIKAYKEQTALAQQEIAAARDQQNAEKRKINEKQIRALRNNYRPSGGFLNNQGKGGLGSDSQLPNKLGT